MRMLMLLALSTLCATFANAAAPSVTSQPFGTLPDGKTATLYTLTNNKGMVITVTDFGGLITKIIVPDKKGTMADVALGFNSLEPYLTNPPYFGALVGRVGNRIAKGAFTLDGKTYSLPKNDGANTLHGGTVGFNKVLWAAEPFTTKSSCGVKLTYTSPDGDQGFPGNLKVTAIYTLNDKNELVVEFSATTDKATPVNLTQHSYFNLKGEGEGTILDHVLTVNADRYVIVDSTLIPTGKLPSVKGTPMDFTKPHAIGERIDKIPGGIDHTFVIDRKNAKGLVHALRLEEPTTGRRLDISTTEPGVQVYTGNFLDGTLTGKSGKPYVKHGGIAMETQHFPDSPNQPSFPSVILRPGEKYQTKTVFAFSTK